MPELPEVETTLRGIEKKVLNKKNNLFCVTREKIALANSYQHK